MGNGNGKKQNNDVSIKETPLKTAGPAHSLMETRSCHRSSSSDAGTEHFVILESTPELDFESAAIDLIKKLALLLEEKGSSRDSLVRIRIYLSDIANQQSIIREVIGSFNLKCHIFLIGLAPTSGSKIAIEAYAVDADSVSKEFISANEFLVKHGKYSSLWIGSYPERSLTVQNQARELFSSLHVRLKGHSGTVENNTQRTWIYVRDIDSNYQFMCDERKRFFADIGLTADTHFIASTGIEGCTETAERVYAMDSHSVIGMDPKQISYVDAKDNLCRTSEYSTIRSYGNVGRNVTFERASQVIYGDRRHIYISGTASIDKDGQILHQKDVVKQTERSLENVTALLKTAGATLNDMRYLIVYIRDISDHNLVRSMLNKCLNREVPFVIVQGRICNPSWLIEMDGFGVVMEKNEEFGNYF